MQRCCQGLPSPHTREGAGEGPELHRPCQDAHARPMDLYDSGDGLQAFPAESVRTRRGAGPAEMSSQPRGAAKGQPQTDLEEEVGELVHLYGLEDDDELADEFVHGHAPRIEVSDYSPHVTTRGEPALQQRDWGVGAEAPEADGLGFGGWGSEGQCQDLREAYRYTRGRSSEEYECYVIPEEEDEEEAADVFCATCKTPLRAAEKVLEEHREHEVAPLSEALESAKVSRSRLSSPGCRLGIAGGPVGAESQAPGAAEGRGVRR